MPLSVDPHHSPKYHGFFLYFSIYQLVSFYYIIFMHANLPFYHSSPSYSLFSISVFTYSFSLSVSLNHYSLPTSCIFSLMYTFHTFLSILIPRLTIPFTLASLNIIRLTNSISPNLVGRYMTTSWFASCLNQPRSPYLWHQIFFNHHS